MRICLVGGGGYLGTPLTQKLLERDYGVTVVDLFWFGDWIGEHSNLVKWPLDARNLSAGELKGFEAVIYMGGLSNDPMSDYWAWGNYLYNTALPAYLARESKLAGVQKFIHAGSCSVYGRVGTPVGEATPPASQTAYGQAKAAVEVPIALLHDHGKFETLNFRMGTIGGWSPRMRFDLIVNTMVMTAVTTGKIVVNDPNATRPILDIHDAVNAYITAIETPIPIYDRTLNLVSENATVMQVAETVKAAVENHTTVRPVIEVTNVKDIRSYAASRTMANLCGFKCTATIAQTAAEVAINIGKLENVRDARFYNIQKLKEIMPT